MIIDETTLVPLKFIGAGAITVGGAVYMDIKRSIKKLETDLSSHSVTSAKTGLYLKLICDKLGIPYDK